MKRLLAVALFAAFLPAAALAADVPDLSGDDARLSYAIGLDIGAQLTRGKVPIDTAAFSDGVRDAVDGNEARLSPQERQAVMTAFQMQQKADEGKLSYAVGFDIGGQLKADKVPLDHAAFGQAIQDGMAEAEPRISMEELQKVVSSFQERRAAERMAVHMKAAQENKEAGDAYLAENAKRDGVTVTDSGLQYEVVEAGTGNKPVASDKVTVHYRGTLLNGEEFDSSYSRGQPATFPVGGVIQGWQEALQLMSEGAKWRVVIPSDLAYGQRGTGRGIGPNETLVFDIELIKVN